MARKALVWKKAAEGRSVGDIHEIGEAAYIDAYTHNLVGNGTLIKCDIPDGANESALLFDDGTDTISENVPLVNSVALASEDDKIGVIRDTRDDYLVKTDFSQLADAPLDAQEVTDWTTYRQELRDLPLKGSKLFDIDSVHSGDDIKLESVDAGGNDVTLEVTDPSANDQSLVVSVYELAIKVLLATDSGGAITSTVQDVIDAINAHIDALELVIASLESGATGSNVIDTEITATNLVGGTDLDSPNWPTAPSTPIVKGIND